MKPHRTKRIALGVCLLLFSPLAGAQERIFEVLHDMLPPDGEETLSIALGDLDGDGDLDALAGKAEQNHLYLNDGTGIFTDVTAVSLPPSSDSTAVVDLGDVDGDGDLDAMIGNTSPPHNRLYLNDGTGLMTDATATSLPPDGLATHTLTLGDVDGDGDLDVLIGKWHRQNRLFLNDGTGVFSDHTTTNLPVDSNWTLALALGDVDGDADLDALIGNGGPNRLYLNDGSGVFTEAPGGHLPSDSDEAAAVVLGDVDGDGDLDAMIGNRRPLRQNRLYLNDGTGVFSDATAVHLPPDSEWTSALVLGDVDGDGDLDALIGNTSPPQHLLYVNDSTGIFTDATATNLPADLARTNALALGDVDGDGDLDVLVGSGQQSCLYLNDGSGVFTDATAGNLPPDSDFTRALVLGDLDGDEDLDALVGNAGQNRCYFNDGSGVFTDGTAINLPPQSDHTRSLALGDVDGDGDLDVMIGNWEPGQNRLYLNGGGGVFIDVTQTNLPSGSGNAIALGDVDGDGDLDALVGTGASNRLYLNDGMGIFTDATATRLPSFLYETTAVALADVDGDGDLDALIANGEWQAQNRLHLNDGSGVFMDATATNLPVRSDASYALSVGDVDGDGDLDAMIGNGMGVYGGSPQDLLYLNDGSGIFADVTATNLPPDWSDTRALVLGDVDFDGDLDALIGNDDYWYGQNRLYLNDGSGVFTDTTATNLPPLFDVTAALALGDVDGDGDLDAMIGNWGGRNRIHTNLTRQLAWRGIPRVGKPLTMDLWGPAGGAWQLAVSLADTSIPLGMLGTLRLDPLLLTPLDCGPFDAQRRGSITYPVPLDPQLVGLTLYWQGVLVFPVSLSNLEITTLTNL